MQRMTNRCGFDEKWDIPRKCNMMINHRLTMVSIPDVQTTPDQSSVHHTLQKLVRMDLEVHIHRIDLTLLEVPEIW